MIGGIYAAYVRAVHSLAHSSSLSTVFPWSLCVGLNVLCGLALAAGGFTVAATVHVLNLEKYKPILRASLVMGFLGYAVAVLGFISDQNLASRLASYRTIWNPGFMLHGIVWVLILYGVLLVLEFAPELCERLGWRYRMRPVRFLNLLALLLAVAISVMCQSILADLLQIASPRISPLWSTPQLPVLFFVSAACAALAALIFASWHSDAAFGKGLSSDLVAGMSRALAALLLLYLTLRFGDFMQRGIPLFVQKNNLDNILLALEIALFFAPVWLLIRERGSVHPRMAYYCAVLVLAGFMTNRLNTCITSVEAATGSRYPLDWHEFMVAYSTIALAVAGFRLTAKRLPVFSELQ